MAASSSWNTSKTSDVLRALEASDFYDLRVPELDVL